MESRPYRDDHELVPSGARLIRRISPHFVEWSDVDHDGNPYVKSQAMQMLDAQRAAAFGCPGPGMSVIVEALADPVGVLIDRYHSRNGDGLAYLEASMIRSDQVGIDFWPTEDEPAHAIVFRFDGGKNMPGALKTSLAAHARAHFIIHPARATWPR